MLEFHKVRQYLFIYLKHDEKKLEPRGKEIFMQEDIALNQIVQEVGDNDWSTVARLLQHQC